jgi:hypothetical protein
MQTISPLAPNLGGRKETQRGFAPLHGPYVIPAKAGIQSQYSSALLATLINPFGLPIIEEEVSG